jgi:phosphoglycolate phosphatase
MVNPPRKIDLVIWDWNGTLLDDTATCYQIANEMRIERGMSAMPSIDDYRAVFGFPVIEYYQRMGYSFDVEPFEAISHQFHAMYAERMVACPLQPCATDALQAVLDRGARQVILSASGQQLLDEQVEMFSLGTYFDRVIGNSDSFAHGKADYARTFLLTSGVSPERALFVGDTDHDFEIAESLGCNCALLVPGHQTREHLAGLGAQLIDSLCEVPVLL